MHQLPGYRPVHPRACGEQGILGFLAVAMSDGSSPRLRGTDRPSAAHFRSWRAVHPRACGEQACMVRAWASSELRFIPAPAGNSPRPGAITVYPSRRFIPAPAGNSRTWSSTEHIDNADRFIPAPAGNSLQCLGFKASVTYRFIPAPAGNSPDCGRRPPCTGSGSSPRLRGTGSRRPVHGPAS